MRVYIWCDGGAMPNGGPAGAGYVVVGHRVRAKHLIQLRKKLKRGWPAIQGGSRSLGFPGAERSCGQLAKGTARGSRRREAPIGGDRFHVNCTNADWPCERMPLAELADTLPARA
jgi:hypothetical protein